MTTWTIKAHAHPKVHQLHELAREQHVSMNKLAERSGVSANTVYGWANKYSPQLHLIEACFNALGYELVVRRIEP